MCIMCVRKSAKLAGLAKAAIAQFNGPACLQSSSISNSLERSLAMFTRQFSAMPAAAPTPSGNANSKDGKVTHPDLLNENLRKAQYAVRGELYNKAVELQSQGKEIIYTNGRLYTPQPHVVAHPTSPTPQRDRAVWWCSSTCPDTLSFSISFY